MFCKSCGNEVNDGAAFCPKCGAQVVIPKSMVSDENSSGQATAEVISNNKMDSTLRLVATILFSVWTIFLIFVVWLKDYRYYFGTFPYFFIPTLSCIISNLCMIYAFLKQESKFIKASLGIGLLGNAVTIIIRVVELYKDATTIPFTGQGGWTRQAYLIYAIIGYDITAGGYQYEEFPMYMFHTLSIILGVVLFALFLRKLHHHISTIFTGIIIALWTICFVWWSLSSDHPVLKGWTPMSLFPLATFLGIAVYALLSIILTRNQAQ